MWSQGETFDSGLVGEAEWEEGEGGGVQQGWFTEQGTRQKLSKIIKLSQQLISEKIS